MDKEKLIKCAEETEAAVAEAVNALYRAQNMTDQLYKLLPFEKKDWVWEVSRKVDYACAAISEQFFKTCFRLSKKVEVLEEEKKEDVSCD